LSTEDLQPDEREAFWRHVMSDTFAPVTIGEMAEGGVAGSISRGLLEPPSRACLGIYARHPNASDPVLAPASFPARCRACRIGLG